MLNLPLRHLALSVEHAKSQLAYQDMLRRRKKLNLSKLLEVLNNPDKFEVEDIELVGQTEDGEDIYRFMWRTKPKYADVGIDWLNDPPKMVHRSTGMVKIEGSKLQFHM